MFSGEALSSVAPPGLKRLPIRCHPLPGGLSNFAPPALVLCQPGFFVESRMIQPQVGHQSNLANTVANHLRFVISRGVRAAQTRRECAVLPGYSINKNDIRRMPSPSMAQLDVWNPAPRGIFLLVSCHCIVPMRKAKPKRRKITTAKDLWINPRSNLRGPDGDRARNNGGNISPSHGARFLELADIALGHKHAPPGKTDEGQSDG
jgi:hypothetical protein